MKWHNISVAEAEEMLSDSGILLLDMRDHRAYLRGHHPRALHLNDQNLRALLKHTARSVPVVIYCDHGHRSQDMAQLFTDFGFTSCYSVDGGYEAWFQSVRQPQSELSEGLKQWMLDQGFCPDNIDQRADNNETALMQLCRLGHQAYVHELVIAGAGLDLVNKDGNNALWMACQSGSTGVARLLLANGINLDQQNDHGATALMYSASTGDLEMVSLLLEAGADTQLTTKDDFSVLDVAATPETLRLLQRYVQPASRYVA